MSRYLAALVTVINGRVRTAVDPRFAAQPHAAALALAVTVAARQQQEGDGP